MPGFGHCPKKEAIRCAFADTGWLTVSSYPLLCSVLCGRISSPNQLIFQSSLGSNCLAFLLNRRNKKAKKKRGALLHKRKMVDV